MQKGTSDTFGLKWPQDLRVPPKHATFFSPFSFNQCGCKKCHIQRTRCWRVCWVHAWRSCTDKHNWSIRFGYRHIQVEQESKIFKAYLTYTCNDRYQNLFKKIQSQKWLPKALSNDLHVYVAWTTLWCLKMDLMSWSKSQKKTSSPTLTRTWSMKRTSTANSLIGKFHSLSHIWDICFPIISTSLIVSTLEY